MSGHRPWSEIRHTRPPHERQRIYGLMVTKNEADRYLEDCLAWHMSFLDGVFVYDDRSDDDTVAIAERHGCDVEVRDVDDPSFLEHEGRFRQHSWELAQESLSLSHGDWVLAFDADEFLVDAATADPVGIRQSLEDAVSHALPACASVRLPRPEIWGFLHEGHDPARPVHRMDGWWGRIECTRLFAWRPHGTIADKAMGCGSEPSYVARSPVSPLNHGLYLLHYGYVDPADRQEKYDRYTGLADHGHNDAHVQSILAVPQLDVWNGEYPPVSRRNAIKESQASN